MIEAPAFHRLGGLVTLSASPSPEPTMVSPGLAPRASGPAERPHRRIQRDIRGGSITILPGSVEHAEGLARDLRPADRLECEAYAGQPAEAVVRASYERSLWSWTAYEIANPVPDQGDQPSWAAFGGADGLTFPERPVCAWGVVPLSILAGRGQPWCLTTERVADHGRLFARASRAWLSAMLADFEMLEGYADGRHAAAMRWLPWLGFRLDAPVTADGVPWRRFSTRRAP